MNINKLVDKSISIITRYYDNEIQPYLDSLDEDVLWIGPAERQWIRGRDNLVAAFGNENNPLTFKMGNISATPITTGRSTCEIILTYIVITNYPDGTQLKHNQRIQMTWVEYHNKTPEGSITRKQKIKMIHISNAFPYDKRDNIYPVHYQDVVQNDSEIKTPSEGKRLLVRDKSQSTHLLSVNSIYWIESYDNSTHTLIHMKDGELISIESLSSISDKYSDCLIRIHASYLVNPVFAKKISRFELEMTDGAILPIPEKKYTSVKRELTEWITKWNQTLRKKAGQAEKEMI
jgi:hypothetical protein